MSLTTYKSQFVAVCGSDPSTKRPSNFLLTSDTGLDWQPTLPPMPIQLYNTSSLGVSSLQALVVVGVSDLKTLNTSVAVLLGDCWHFGAPMSTPCRNLQSVCHDDRLYFMGGSGTSGTVYSCSSTSLISSCKDSFSSSAANKQIWQKERLCGMRARTAVSFSSKLIFIDDKGTIGVCSDSAKLLVNIASEGDKPRDSSLAVTASVLPSGNLLCIHDGYIYKVKLSG